MGTTNGNDCGAEGKFWRPNKKSPATAGDFESGGTNKPHCADLGSFVGCLLLGDFFVSRLFVGSLGGLDRLRRLGDRCWCISSHGSRCSSGGRSGCGRLGKSTSSEQTGHEDSEEFFHICRFQCERGVEGRAVTRTAPPTTIAAQTALTGFWAIFLSLKWFETTVFLR